MRSASAKFAVIAFLPSILAAGVVRAQDAPAGVAIDIEFGEA